MSEDTHKEYKYESQTKMMRWLFACLIMGALGVWGIIAATYFAMNRNEEWKTIDKSIDRLQESIIQVNNLKIQERAPVSVPAPQIITEKVADTETPKKIKAINLRITKIEDYLTKLEQKIDAIPKRPEIDQATIDRAIRELSKALAKLKQEMRVQIDTLVAAKEVKINKKITGLYKYMDAFAKEVKEKISLVTKTEGALLPPPKDILERD
jgi:septal ring factor EnvC (AmiA/AmiB activator)